MADLTIDFINVQESRYALPSKVRAKLRATRVALAMYCFQEIISTNIFDIIGMPDPYDQHELLSAISRTASSMPLRSDHMFVCILTKTEDDEETETTHNNKFNITTGIHVDQDKAVSWDSVGEAFNDVLQSCKPPIPCLKRTKITQHQTNKDLKEEQCCAICLQELVVGSEAASTACSHVYHSECIVKWLSKTTSCPLCRSRLPVT